MTTIPPPDDDREPEAVTGIDFESGTGYAYQREDAAARVARARRMLRECAEEVDRILVSLAGTP